MGRTHFECTSCFVTFDECVDEVHNAGKFYRGLSHLGWSESTITYVGIVEILCVVFYAIPRTAVLGAILITGYLGGATATHVRVGDQFFIPILIGIVVWLRDKRLRAVLPLT